MKHDVGLTALIVNYNTGSYAKSCVESLQREWAREGRDPAKLKIHLIDNASPQPQEEWLVQIEALGVDVLRSEDNCGYAEGLNRLYARSQGEPGDVVAFLNPDLHFLPGTIGTLMDYVKDHPECGVVDANACIDALGTFHLPRNLLPTPIEHWRMLLTHLHPFFGKLYSKYRLKKGLVWWTSKEPVITDMLSGCCLFLRREVVDEMGRPMDPAYPLYFEDTDLFRTLNKMGYTVVHHTQAPILHHWSRSALIGNPIDDEPTKKAEISKGIYYRKFYGPLSRAFMRIIDLVAYKWPKDKIGRPTEDLVDLGEWEKPLRIELPRKCRYLIEFAIQPNFVICCGAFGEGDVWESPESSWEWLFPIRYFARAIDLDTMEVIGAWSFVRAGMGRQHAMTYDEVDQIGDQLMSRMRSA